MDLSAIDIREVSFALLFFIAFFGAGRFISKTLWPDVSKLIEKFLNNYLELKNRELEADIARDTKMTDALENLSAISNGIQTSLIRLERGQDMIFSMLKQKNKNGGSDG